MFRVGGDEFAVIIQDGDYEHLEELLGKMADRNTKALRDGGIVIACGAARYENDSCAAEIFDRADQIMYRNKNELKAASRRTA